MLSLAGEVVTLFEAGKVNRRWKERRWERPAVIRYYRRRDNGQWDEAAELTEKFNLPTMVVDQAEFDPGSPDIDTPIKRWLGLRNICNARLVRHDAVRMFE